MQKRNSIISTPLLCGIIISVAAHVAALYSNGTYTPAEPLLDTGKTVVSLTLIPTIANPDRTPEQPIKESTPEPKIPVPEDSVVAPIPVSIPMEPKPAQQPEPEKPADESAPQAESVASTEQLASLQLDKGVTSTAVVDGIFKPAYPRISQRRNETGTVTLSVQVMPDGSVGKVNIIQSSGYKRLDESATTGAKKTSFKPALERNQPVESTTQLSFTFNLTDD